VALGNEAKPIASPGPALEGAMLSRQDQDDLAGLTWNWSPAYTFALTSGGIWTATAAGNPATVLTADTADDLRRLVRADYAGRPRVANLPVTSHLSELKAT
jgi:hypothetical protein